MLERILLTKTDQVTAVAERYNSVDGKLSAQCRKELCARPGVSYDKRSGGANVHSVVSAEFFSENSGA